MIRDFPKTTVILRGYNFEQVDTIANILEERSDRFALEITLNSNNALSIIKKIKEKHENLYVGAGTVLNLEQANLAIESNCDFMLSPIILDRDTIELCNNNKVFCIPGAYTPSEVYKMLEYGANAVKLFPFSCIDEKFISSIKAPLGDIPIMAVGGINKYNAKSALLNGATYLGIGSGIFDKKNIETMNISSLIRELDEFEEYLK